MLAELANIGEFLGGFAVLFSLVYLAIQIRQNTRSIRAQSELVMNQRFADWHGRANEHPELSRIWDAATDNWEGMTEEEVRRYRWFIAELFLVYQACFQLYQQGDLVMPPEKTMNRTLDSDLPSLRIRSAARKRCLYQRDVSTRSRRDWVR